MIYTFPQFQQQITKESLLQIHTHFKEIYECNELTSHEFKITYLAYLWKNKYVHLNDGLYEIKDEQKLGINMNTDYELDYEVAPENTGGINLGTTHDFYVIDKLENLIQFKN